MNRLLFLYDLSNKIKIFNIKLNKQHKNNSSAYSTSQEIKQPNKNIFYYKFNCKCRIKEEFTTFTNFLKHIKTFHNIEKLDLNLLKEIITKFNNNNKEEIKFYWGLKCKCGHNFTSSLCNADLTIKKNKITLLKLYNLQCKICKQTAQFKNKDLLNKFLEERVLQRLIYKHYKNEFSKYNTNEDKKRLEGHIPQLCEKCKLSSSGHCWED